MENKGNGFLKCGKVQCRVIHIYKCSLMNTHDFNVWLIQKITYKNTKLLHQLLHLLKNSKYYFQIHSEELRHKIFTSLLMFSMITCNS